MGAVGAVWQEVFECLDLPLPLPLGTRQGIPKPTVAGHTETTHGVIGPFPDGPSAVGGPKFGLSPVGEKTTSVDRRLGKQILMRG